MSRGIRRERYVKDWLEARGWWVSRAAGSLGDADLVALMHVGTFVAPTVGGRPIPEGKLLVEVKSTVTPYSHFGPRDRFELLRAGRISGAAVVLCWTPSARGKRVELNWIFPDAWPGHGVLSMRQPTEDGGSDDACVREAGL